MKPSSDNKDTLIGQASRALGWSFLSNAGARVGTLAIGVLLARLLGPRDFGTFAVALVALLAVLSFNELGVSLAIVRWQGDPAEIAPTVTTLSLLSSVIIYLGCFFGAPVFSTAMGAPAATNVIRVLALNVIVDGAIATPAALLQRYFRQDKKLIADQVNNWLGAAISITLAVSHFGAMSLAIGRIAGAGVAGVLFMVFSPLPFRLGFERDKARALLRFGMPLAGASIVVFAVTNVDQLVVGHLLGATALGFYVLAFNLASWPVTIFSQPVRSVAPAVFSRLQHDPAAMRAGFLSTTGALGAVTLPVCFLISGITLPLIGFLYGSRWLPAAHALLWLGVLGALRILFELIYDYFVVLALPRVIFTIQLVWLIALIPAVIIGVHVRGIAGAGMAEVAVAGCVVFPWYLGELSRVGIRLRSVAGKLWMPLLGAIGAGLFGVAAHRWISYNLAALLVSGIAVLAVIGLLLFRMRPDLATLRSISSRSAEPAAAEPAARAESVVPDLAGPGIGRPDAELSMIDMTMPIPAIREHVRLQRRLEEAMAAAGSVWPPMYQDSTGPLPIYRDMTGMPPPAPYPLYQDSTMPLPTYRDVMGMSGSSRYHPTGSARRLSAIGRHRRPEWIGAAGSEVLAEDPQPGHETLDLADPDATQEIWPFAHGERRTGHDK